MNITKTGNQQKEQLFAVERAEGRPVSNIKTQLHKSTKLITVFWVSRCDTLITTSTLYKRPNADLDQHNWKWSLWTYYLQSWFLRQDRHWCWGIHRTGRGEEDFQTWRPNAPPTHLLWAPVCRHRIINRGENTCNATTDGLCPTCLVSVTNMLTLCLSDHTSPSECSIENLKEYVKVDRWSIITN